MKTPVASVLGAMLAFALATATPAQAAKTYNDPWLEGDLQQMRVPAALDILARTPSPVIVGDIDSGARLTDPDLASHLTKLTGTYTCVSAYGPGPDYVADAANGDFGCDFVGSGQEGAGSTVPDGDPTDSFGHGTATAAVIAGLVNNGVGGAGVAPNARVLPVRACYGGNPDCTAELAINAVTYAVAKGATIINASWPPDMADSATFRSFVHSHSNVLFDFAIGGSGQNGSPYALCTDKTTYPNVICVGSTNANDTAGTTDGDTTTDVSAPGYGAVPSASGVRAEFSGTASAAANVSGAAAVLRGIAPNLTPSAIRQALVSTSRQVAGFSTANKAHGIIDLEAAVRSVQQTAGLTTPAAGHGAAADATDPFPGQTATNTPAPTPTPTPAPVVTPTPGPPILIAPTPTVTPIALAFVKPPSSVRAGSTLSLRVRVTGGTGTVAAKLTNGKKTLAKASKKKATGLITLKLKLARSAKTGKAKLAVQIGTAKPLTRTIKVQPHR